MGQTTFVKPAKIQGKDIRKKLRASRVDLPFVLIVLCLVIIGLLAVYSTSLIPSKLADDNPHEFAIRQVIWAVLGSGVAAFLTIYDYHKLKDWSLIIMGVTITLLIIVLLPVAGTLGRHLFNNSIQPSELAKAVIVIYLSVWLTARQDVLGSFSLGFFPMISIVGIVGGLIIIQPDVSAVLTIFILGGLMFYFAGGKSWQIVLMVIMAAPGRCACHSHRRKDRTYHRLSHQFAGTQARLPSKSSALFRPSAVADCLGLALATRLPKTPDWQLPGQTASSQ